MRKNHMKKVALSILAIVLGLALVPMGYALEVGAQTIDIDVGTTYVSKYIFRGIDTFANDDGGFQPYATLTVHPFNMNLSGGFWASYALTRGHEDLDEQDYWASLDMDITDILNAGFGYTYYDFFNADSDGDINEFQFFGSLANIPLPGDMEMPILGGDNIPVSVGYLAAYAYGQSSNAGGINDGWYHEASFGIEVPIPGTEEIPGQEEGITLAYDNIIGWYAGKQLGLSGHYWTQSLSTSFALPANMSLSPSINYQSTGSSGVSFNAEDEFYFTLDLSVSF